MVSRLVALSRRTAFRLAAVAAVLLVVAGVGLTVAVRPRPDPACNPGGTVVAGPPVAERPPVAPVAAAGRTPGQTAGLVADILRVIEELEIGTGRPVTESRYDTSSGTRASYASRMQATVPWSIDLLRRHPELRAAFALTPAELEAAQVCSDAAAAAWRAVTELPAGTTPEQARRNAPVARRLQAAGFAEADLRRMLAFGTWRHQVIDGLQRHRRGRAVGTRQVVDQLSAAGAAAGIDARSARSYVAQELAHQRDGRVSAHWGEDRAAWRRFAIEKSLPVVGEKLRLASVDREGLTLGRVSITDAVASISGRHPDWSDDRVAWQAFKQHNGSSAYADRGLRLFRAVHRPPVSSPPGQPV